MQFVFGLTYQHVQYSQNTHTAQTRSQVYDTQKGFLPTTVMYAISATKLLEEPVPDADDVAEDEEAIEGHADDIL